MSALSTLPKTTTTTATTTPAHFSTLPVLPKKPLPAGRPREWYVTHNRQLKAMRIAIALLDTGVYTPQQAHNGVIRATADRIGVHPPSTTTCRLVRSLLP